MQFKGLMAAAVGVGMLLTGSAVAQDRGAIGDALDRGQLILMNNLTSPPWQFRDQNGNPAGFSVDLSRLLAAQLDLDLRLIDVDWAGLIPGLLSKKTDLVASSMTTTLTRAQQVQFTTETWYETGVVAIVPGATNLASWEELNASGKRIAVKAGTSAVDVAKEYFGNAEIQTYPSDVDLYQALKAKRVDAALNDKAVMDVVEKEYGFTTLVSPRELISSDQWAFAVRPDDNFTRQYLDFVLRRIKENGQLAALHAYWAGGDAWQADFLAANSGVSQARLDLVEHLGIQDYVPEANGTRLTLQ